MLKFGGGWGELKIFLSFYDDFNLKVKYFFNQIKYSFLNRENYIKIILWDMNEQE